MRNSIGQSGAVARRQLRSACSPSGLPPRCPLRRRPRSGFAHSDKRWGCRLSERSGRCWQLPDPKRPSNPHLKKSERHLAGPAEGARCRTKLSVAVESALLAISRFAAIQDRHDRNVRGLQGPRMSRASVQTTATRMETPARTRQRSPRGAWRASGDESTSAHSSSASNTRPA